MNQILDGIPLPKDHGDLIDRSNLPFHVIPAMINGEIQYLDVVMARDIIDAPAIVKATKGGD